MKRITEEWFLNNGFIKEGDTNPYFFKSRYDMKYLFKFRDFANDWTFYVEYTDSPVDSDKDMKHPVIFGLETTEHIERLWELITLT